MNDGIAIFVILLLCFLIVCLIIYWRRKFGCLKRKPAKITLLPDKALRYLEQRNLSSQVSSVHNEPLEILNSDQSQTFPNVPNHIPN